MEFLKAIFGDKALTYEELSKALEENKEIKLVNLAEGGYVSKDKFDNKVLELDGVSKQLKDANKTIQSYKDMDIESIKQSAEDWKAKYETETKELKDDIAKKDYEINAREYLSKYQFASNRIKNSIFNDFVSKEFVFKDGQFVGADEYMAGLQESEPTSFANTTPTIKGATPVDGIKDSQQIDTSKMTYTELCEYMANNPNTQI